MVNHDIVLQKVDQIQNCLKRIEEKIRGNPDKLEEYDEQDIFVLNLQRAVQSAIDLAAHVVADAGLGLPGELRENFTLLRQAKIIGKDLCQNLEKMVGFRNIAVHEYEILDVEILKSIYKNHLKDLEDFYVLVMKRFKLG